MENPMDDLYPSDRPSYQKCASYLDLNLRYVSNDDDDEEEEEI